MSKVWTIFYPIVLSSKNDIFNKRCYEKIRNNCKTKKIVQIQITSLNEWNHPNYSRALYSDSQILTQKKQNLWIWEEENWQIQTSSALDEFPDLNLDVLRVLVGLFESHLVLVQILSEPWRIADAVRELQRLQHHSDWLWLGKQGRKRGNGAGLGLNCGMGRPTELIPQIEAPLRSIDASENDKMVE